MIGKDQFRALVNRGDGACETVVEMLERKLIRARILHASQCQARKSFNEDDKSSRFKFSLDLLDHYAQQIAELRFALAGLYARVTPC